MGKSLRSLSMYALPLVLGLSGAETSLGAANHPCDAVIEKPGRTLATSVVPGYL
jgi:hypothetical protein